MDLILPHSSYVVIIAVFIFIVAIRTVHYVAAPPPPASTSSTSYGGTVYYNSSPQQQQRKEKETTDMKMAGIIHLMLNSKKPLVAHNGLLDLMHLTDKFVKPLPDTLSEFKQLWSHIPIYDTKYLATILKNQPDPKLTTLKILSKQLQFDTTYVAYHDAGYDALITGRIFCSLLQQHFGGNLGNTSKVANKLFIGKSDYECWNLRDLKQMVERSLVFRFESTVPPSVFIDSLKELIVTFEVDPVHENRMLIKLYHEGTLELLRKFGSIAPYKPTIDNS